MAFIVYDTTGGYENYGDEDKYGFNKAGLLVTVREEGKARKTYSPGAWSCIEDVERPGSMVSM